MQAVQFRMADDCASDNEYGDRQHISDHGSSKMVYLPSSVLLREGPIQDSSSHDEF
jgi:hypothetical protein